MSVNAAIIRAELHVTLGAVIRRDVDVVIERWTKRAMEEQSNAGRLHHDAMVDHLPGLLKALGRSLAESHAEETAKHKPPARQHGQQRWEIGWSLAEVMQDYQILRLVLVEYLEETMARPLTTREFMAIGLALDEAVNASVNSFMRENDERSKKADQALTEKADLLKESNSRKDIFLAVIGHELRNPLAATRNAVDVLSLQGTDPAKVEWVRGLLDRQVTQMTRMVDDLLDASRIGRGKFTIQRDCVDFVALVRHAVEDGRAAALAAGLTLVQDLPESSIWVDGDTARLTQIATNLLHNATKFTPRGGKITVQVARADSEPRVTLAVRDTGIGIEPHLLARIFEPFMQGDLSLERSRGGLGLGLALVKGLVELHGGEVSAASGGVYQGTEFRLWLPCVEKRAAQPAERLTMALHGSKLRILLVEDNRDSAESLKLLLEHVGHEVTVAESGTEALAHARGQIPDVVLCDLALPGMSGFEVAESLRAERGKSSLVIVAISGHGSDGDQEQTRAAGFALHMTKPIDFGVLLKFLASVKKPD